MATGNNPYAPLLEKLQIPHPLLQRCAVSAIFEKFRFGPAHAGLKSSAGQEAFTQCLVSQRPAVIDQTVSEICKLCEDDVITVKQGLQDLQSALDAAGPESIESLVNGIGFLCRLVLRRIHEGKDPSLEIPGVRSMQSSSVHPLVKAFKSRQEAHMAIINSLGLILIQESQGDLSVVLHFLNPFLTHVLLQPMVSSSHALFARHLHSQLTVLACSRPVHAPVILKFLLGCIQQCQLHTSQEKETVISGLKELVDVFDCLLKSVVSIGREEEVKALGSELLNLLMGLTHELQNQGFSPLSALVLVRRVVHLLHDKNLPSLLHSEVWKVHMVGLAHMLAMVELEQEQLLLLELASMWVEDDAVALSPVANDSMSSFPGSLIWVFPALHIMSFPSMHVKIQASHLLQSIEQRVKYIMLTHDRCIRKAEQRASTCSSSSYGEQCLAMVVLRLLNAVWSEDNDIETWVSFFADCSLLGSLHSSSSAHDWLKVLVQYLQRQGAGVSRAGAGLSGSMVVWICMIGTVLALHPNTGLSVTSIDALAAIGRAEPIWGVSVLPVVLFCLRLSKSLGDGSGTYSDHFGNPDVQLGFLKVLPNLACHPATMPLVVQTLQPLLDYKSDPVVQATAVRLLCRTWEYTDRVFSQLQGVLQATDISQPMNPVVLCLSQAASIRDVCRKNPDRGVDLVLSIQACIESSTSFVCALGLQSLALLCKDDSIDFYTAWLVLSKLFPSLPSDPIVAESLCEFIGHGSLDAAAYPQAAATLIGYLYEACSRLVEHDVSESDVWWRTRAAAIEALSLYEVEMLELALPEKVRFQVDLLLSETSPAALHCCEGLVIKSLDFEHKTRRRGGQNREENKSRLTKLGKLLHALPHILFAPATVVSKKFKRVELNQTVVALPGASLVCLEILRPQHVETKGGASAKKELQKALVKWDADYESVFQECAEELNVSGNLVLAMILLQSWSLFFPRWLNAKLAVMESLPLSNGNPDLLNRVAMEIYSLVKKTAEDEISRVADNGTLALAALCKALPPMLHSVMAVVGNHLEAQLLLQDGHEHRQWSAALALGVLASCLHATDFHRKLEISHRLMVHARTTDRGTVLGACGVGLGIICQSLLLTNVTGETLEGLTKIDKNQEVDLLLQIVSSLIHLTMQVCPRAADQLRALAESTLLSGVKFWVGDGLNKNHWQKEDDDMWGVCGLVWGLGSAVTALERAQCIPLVLNIANLMISWLPEEIPSFHKSLRMKTAAFSEAMSLATGAVLVLPTCVEVCLRLELLEEADVSSILQRLCAFVDKGINNKVVEKGTTKIPGLATAAACVGAGNLLAVVLEERGIGSGHDNEVISSLLNVLNTAGSGALQTVSGGRLCAMMGIANALGAGAALLAPSRKRQFAMLLKETRFEDEMQTMVQALLAVTRDASDAHERNCAGWALGFMHNAYLEAHGNGFQTEESSEASQWGYPMRSLQSFPDESCLKQLCLWLLSFRTKDLSLLSPPPVHTLVSVLRVLEKAPRLPGLDWGALLHFLMRGFDFSVRQQCVLFALAHAEFVPPLATFLDELCELARLCTIEPALCNLLMRHLGGLVQQIFTQSRSKKLIEEVQELALNVCTHNNAALYGGFGGCVWQGLSQCLQDRKNVDRQNSMKMVIERCMETLIHLLPFPVWRKQQVENGRENDWPAAIECLMHVRKEWILHTLPTSNARDEESLKKAIIVKARLIAKGCLSPSELKPALTYVMDCPPLEVHSLLLEIVSSVQEFSADDKQLWLLDSIDSACIAKYPITGLQLVGLIASSWCWSSLLCCPNLDSAVEDLPLSIPLLLAQPIWSPCVNSFVQKWMVLVDRTVERTLSHDKKEMGTTVPFKDNNNDHDILQILLRTCIGLRNHLPLDYRFRLTNLNFNTT
ncbi:unnamed protein product [Sphagnum jensenii]|uniref:DUF3730 domain-containing protein n=1 Tax=Sphagnum jensenii TaxID=128206 RepID=A0ABP0XI83_9BRYO